MKLLPFASLFAGSYAELDAIPYNIQVWKARTSRLFVKWDTVGSSTVSDWNVVVREADSGIVRANINDNNKPAGTQREISRLNPRTKYEITIRATDGNDEGPEGVIQAFTSPRPVDNARVTLAYENAVNLEWDVPSTGADQYRVWNVNDMDEEYFTTSPQLMVDMIPGQKKDFYVQSVSCDDCENKINDAFGKPILVTGIAVPPAPTGVYMTDITESNFETADATITWSKPDVGQWDIVKIEYSPNNPEADTETPSYHPDAWGNSFQIKGLYQNTVYTITVRFVSNNVEGPAEVFTWGIPDAETKKAPAVQNCQVPTYLRPEDLRVRRDVFENEMSVSWDHPRAKKPENGYRLVFAPYSHISTQKPWYETIDKDETSFKLRGPKYDPYEEYSISLIALHDEQMDNPHSPDFIASHFTGTYLKNQAKGTFVAPDACCGSERHNSKTSSCCGGSLIEDGSGLLCCKDMPYSMAAHKCCGDGRIVSNTEKC